MKRSMHDAILDALGVGERLGAVPRRHGHERRRPAARLDRAGRAGELADGDVVLLLAAGIGYTWAASVVRWGGV